MKKITLTLAALFCAGNLWAADTKISDFTADATPTTDDLMVTVNAPGGTPANRKTTIANLQASVFQPLDADLTTYAGITPSANVQTFLGSANYAAMTGLPYVVTESDPVFDALFDAYTILYANVDDTPAALTLSTYQVGGRLDAGFVAIDLDSTGDCAAGDICSGGHTHSSYAPLASPGITGDPTITDETPSLTGIDSNTDAAGTFYVGGKSAGTQNVQTCLTTEDSNGESQVYLCADGPTKTLIPYKPIAVGPLYINGTDDALSDEGYAGTIITGTAGAALAVGDIVYLSDTDGRWELADNDSTTAEANQAKGVCVLTAAADGSATNILIHGKMRLDSWAWNDNEGQPLYLSATAGDLTETRPISASEAPQIVAYIESDDEIFVNPQPIDFSRTRTATDADGETLTCLEVQNTIWEVTAAATIVGPALSACPVQDFTIFSSVAGAVVYDPNAADDTIVDGTAKGDGVAWTSGSALGDMISIKTYDTDTLIGASDGWTAP